jgi:[acyl-carrier-protein] S-malonyltransferase
MTDTTLEHPIAFVFPGQGSQAPGMARSIAQNWKEASDVLARVDEALGEKLSALMFEGPAETLTQTANAQPALMAASLCVVAALKAEGVAVSQAAFVAGHSLGEYSALAATGAFDIETTAQLLRIRGNAMQRAVPIGKGTMAALLGATSEQAEAACAAGSASGVVEIANDNAPGQIVISGDVAAVEAAIEAIKALGVRKAMLLPVSAPFHCSLMQPAADAMAEALARHAPSSPSVPLVSNITARPTTDAAAIGAALVAQVTGRVRWRESLDWMTGEGGAKTIIELGSGKVLTQMLKRAAPGVGGFAINEPDDVRSLAEKLLSQRSD